MPFLSFYNDEADIITQDDVSTPIMSVAIQFLFLFLLSALRFLLLFGSVLPVPTVLLPASVLFSFDFSRSVIPHLLLNFGTYTFISFLCLKGLYKKKFV